MGKKKQKKLTKRKDKRTDNTASSAATKSDFQVNKAPRRSRALGYGQAGLQGLVIKDPAEGGMCSSVARERQRENNTIIGMLLSHNKRLYIVIQMQVAQAGLADCAAFCKYRR